MSCLSPIKQALPTYPVLLRAKGITGEATIQLVVDVDGSVRDAKIVKQTHEAFGEAALECVKKWKYRPALRDGVPVRVRMQVPIHFDPKTPAPKATP